MATSGGWLSVKEIAGRCGVHPMTVLRWIDSGDAPPHYRIGRRLRFKLDEFEDWLKTRRGE